MNIRSYIGKTPTNFPLKTSNPAEIVNAVLFLASPHTSFVTGTELLVDSRLL
ncbi:SDR family oxidoreductase [Sphingobacterium gobiense]|uniref:SDR family oxidoreductase n=1 Tax=Sphingobacterium gobiense TaxID=1382456 RepID=UPI0011B06017